MNDPTSASTLVDLNRAGTGLIEIISEADMHTSAEAAAYVRKVQSLLRAVGASDANMEKVCTNRTNFTSRQAIWLTYCFRRDPCGSTSMSLSPVLVSPWARGVK